MGEFTKYENDLLTLLPPFEHKEMKDNDCGLQNHPNSSNYTTHFWKSRTRSGGVEVPDQKPAKGSDS